LRHVVGQALQNVSYSDITLLVRYRRLYGHFLKPTDSILSNNAIILHHLTTHSTTCWPTKWRSYCDHRYV